MDSILRRAPVLLFLCSIGTSALAQTSNEPLNSPGKIPQDAQGRTLNLNFETGDLRDWTATGSAWKGQPFRGEIDQKRIYGAGRHSQHTGEYWLGGFERVQDGPTGTLTSASFPVTSRWASFLVGGGEHEQTRVELVRADTKEVIASVSGVNQEEMRPVVVDLQPVQGKEIFIRIVDEVQGGWGHVNFDDFRLHDEKPRFQQPQLALRSAIAPVELYPYENLSGEEAARAMKVPAGFKVQLAAQEPDVQQPIAMAIDDRGRVWIAEAYAYPNRRPEGTGKDRILIFEDTNQDGTLDKRTVFVEGLNLVSGLEIGFGGVWVGAAPYLLFIPDRNGNDIPDGLEAGASKTAAASVQFPKDVPPGAEVLLDGWAWQDTHETLNAFIWGPDGWLYGCHGVFTHSRVGRPGTKDEDRMPINAGVWRYHPVQHRFEVFAHGTSNPWGVDFNEYGDAFITACVIPHLYYMIPGARYQRQGGQHFNSFTYDDIKTIARHRHFVGNQWNNNDRRASDDSGGGHAHAGAMIYQGGAWPAEYTGKLFMHNIHGNRINIDVLIPEGSGYAGDRHPDFLLTGDKWSQMIYLTYGPDGQVWTIDWYDQNQCHHFDEKIHDRSNGRIFRISYGDTAPTRVDLQQASNEELIRHALFDRNEWYVRHARRILQERAQTQPVDWAAVTETKKIREDNPQEMLRLMWLLNNVGEFQKSRAMDLSRLLANDNPHVRAWTIRLLIQQQPDSPLSASHLAEFIRLAANDPSPIVRLELASAAQRIPLSQRWDLLEALVSHPEDRHDHNLPLMYWYAMEPLAEANPQRALALGMAAGENIPLLREFTIRRLGSGQPEEALALLVQGLSGSTDDTVRATFLKGIRGALVGTKGISAPAAWADVAHLLLHSQRSSADPEIAVNVLGLSGRFGDEQAGAQLRELVVDESVAADVRRLALSYLVENRDSGLGEVVARLLKGATLRTDALRAVATVDDAGLARAVVDSYASLSPTERADARNALASRPAYAVLLLESVRDQRIPRTDLSADLVRQLRNLDDHQVNELLRTVWGVVRESDRNRKLLIARYMMQLRDQNAPAGNAEEGRAIFSRTCQQCHTLFGAGGKVGPDITGSNRANLEYLLSNVLDPSAVMAKEYQPTILATTDGRIITGIVKEESDNALSLQTTNELLTVSTSDIEARRQSETSMMPDDLLKNLTLPQVRSLVAYLASPGQTALLATPETVDRFFNGKDLTSWRSSREEDSPLWSVENGEIVGRSQGLKHNAFLMSELSLGDFHFTCEVKLVKNEGNSGIQFRSQPLANGEMKGDQADIGVGWWGKLYEEGGRGLLVNNDAEKLIRPGEWNKYEIIAVGSRVQTRLNDQPAVDLNDPEGARSGVIAFQLHAGGPTEVRFRNLQLALHNPVPEYAAQGSQPDAFPASTGGKAAGKITWKKTTLDSVFRSEGCCIADFDNDGDMDIGAGSAWYEQVQSPDGTTWKQHAVREKLQEFDPRSYSDTFMNFADDVNHDGWIDLIVVGFPEKSTHWFENPGSPASAGPWVAHEMIPVTNNESPQYLDVTGDGRRELLSGVAGNVLAWTAPTSHADAPWKSNAISAGGTPAGQKFAHGLGAGDINGDGRTDVLAINGWWEGPSNLNVTDWRFHEAKLGEMCSQMRVFDFDNDGDADVLSTSAHKFGVWWHEQQSPDKDSPEGGWVTHLIDESISQTHSNVLADINGDGLPDLVTGKRWWAHAPPPPDSPFPGDPGVNDPAVIAWYELSREEGRPVWTRHQVDDNSGVGTQFEVADVNGDGLLDIVSSNKKGTHLLEQVRAE